MRRTDDLGRPETHAGAYLVADRREVAQIDAQGWEVQVCARGLRPRRRFMDETIFWNFFFHPRRMQNMAMRMSWSVTDPSACVKCCRGVAYPHDVIGIDAWRPHPKRKLQN